MGLFTAATGDKTQLSRLVAILAVGPLWVLAGFRSPIKFIKYGLVSMGLATIVYNIYFYIKKQETGQVGGRQTGQAVRLLDIFVFGPFVMYAGAEEANKYLGCLLFMSGFGTSMFNLHNYTVVEKIAQNNSLPNNG